MFQIDPQSRFAVYEQIIDQFERFLLIGVLTAGDKMPSVRNLSVELRVNPNTVQRAYIELERGGFTDTIKGKGTFVSKDALMLIKKKKRENLKELSAMVKQLKLAGVEKEEITAQIDEIYGGNE